METELTITTYKIRRDDEQTICNCLTWIDKGMRAYVVEDQYGVAQGFICCSQACAQIEQARIEQIN